jgi:GT2 family glycosyltransferase
VAFVNQDAFVDPEALRELARVALRPDVGLATGSVRLADEPETINSAGNVVHFLGFGWSGGFGDRAAAHSEEREVAAASGTALALRRSLWQQLDGFAEQYFAYHEDAELSLRSWQLGLAVRYVPTAIVRHRYEFSRNAEKYYLLERNRLLGLLTLLEGRTLLLLAPALVLVEAAIVALALKEGWAGRKVAGWAWLVRNRRWVMDRRRRLQRERTCNDRALAPLFAGHLDPANLQLPRAVRPVDRLLSGYWRVVRRLLRNSPGQPR